jgi:hypothetical protein
MRHRINKKLVMWVLAFFLLIPMTAQALLAQGKLCCKLLCPKDMKQEASHCPKAKSPAPLSPMEPGNCCDTNCVGALLFAPSIDFVFSSELQTTIAPEKSIVYSSPHISSAQMRGPPWSLPNLRDRLFLSSIIPLYIQHSSYLI